MMNHQKTTVGYPIERIEHFVRTRRDLVSCSPMTAEEVQSDPFFAAFSPASRPAGPFRLFFRFSDDAQQTPALALAATDEEDEEGTALYRLAYCDPSLLPLWRSQMQSEKGTVHDIEIL